MINSTHEITHGIQQATIFEEWKARAEAVSEAVLQHPTKGQDEGFNRFSPDHLQAQLTLATSLNAEQELRNALKQEVAARSFDDLDVIGKLAILKSLDMQKPLAKEAFTRIGHNSYRMNSDPDRKRDERIQALYEQPVKPKGSMLVLARASVLDSCLRDIDSRIRDGSRVKVTENMTWSELRTLYRSRNRATFHATTRTHGIIDNKSRSFPINHPDVVNGSVVYEVPHDIRHVRKGRIFGKNNRDNYMNQRSNISPHYDEALQDWFFTVPLLAIKKVIGESTQWYERDNSIKPDVVKTAVKINMFNLPTVPIRA